MTLYNITMYFIVQNLSNNKNDMQLKKKYYYLEIAHVHIIMSRVNKQKK